MRIFAIIISLGLLMTMPGPLAQELPGAIHNSEISPAVARTGVVTDISEANNITVNLSGSNVLVTASYLFPAYEPLLGDIVYLTKQDSQWLVLGTMSGPPNSLAPNPSFEDGTLSTTPDQWSAVPVVTTAGTPTFRKELALPVEGRYIGIFRNSSAGVAGQSSINVVSSYVPAEEGTIWATGFFLTYAEPDVNAALEPQGGYIQITSSIQFSDLDGVLISDLVTNFIPMTSSFSSPFYVRTLTQADALPYVIAPVGTAQARIKLNVVFQMHTNCASELGIDLVYLRRINPGV